MRLVDLKTGDNIADVTRVVSEEDEEEADAETEAKAAGDGKAEVAA